MEGVNPRILITNYDTHPPEKWAEVLLDELVPTIHNVSLKGLTKIEEAKAKLYPAVVELCAAVRAAERDGLFQFTPQENEAAAAVYNYYHSGTDKPAHWHLLHREVSKNKILPSTEWAEQHVHKICRIASEIDGCIGSNEMPDEVYRCLDRWIRDIQFCERSHHVTSNNLHTGAI